MFYELIMFGGVLFWALFALLCIFELVWVETDSVGGLGFIIGLALFYAFSQPPIIGWQWIVSYLVIGLVWFFVMFHWNLSKVRKYLKDNPEMKEKTIYGWDVDIRHIYDTEPSFSNFVDRLFAWPFSMIRVFFGDFIFEVYNQVAKFLVQYKDKYLGLK